MVVMEVQKRRKVIEGDIRYEEERKESRIKEGVWKWIMTIRKRGGRDDGRE